MDSEIDKSEKARQETEEAQALISTIESVLVDGIDCVNERKRKTSISSLKIPQKPKKLTKSHFRPIWPIRLEPRMCGKYSVPAPELRTCPDPPSETDQKYQV
ncbi:hypothetical protein KKH18_03555, partial [bacterium]|nr:hypothetical protein [bacterium]